MTRWALVVPAVVAGIVLVVVLRSCVGSEATGPTTIRVPGDEPTIAAAVAAARPGATVVIAPGTYHEAVEVTVRGITIRGEDRNGVVLDGRNTLLNGISVAADGVAIENLTVHGYNQNGVVFNGIDAVSEGQGASPGVTYGAGDDALRGFRVSWVTTYDNGLYGIYAFASRDGLIEHSYASGHPDSGIYVGQCRPCNTVIRDVVAERNAIGYYGTNASGGVYVVDSVFRKNRLGLAPNSQKMEQLHPQAETVIAGNLVVDNDDPTAPKIPNGYFGGGIAVGGGTRNTILRNRVSGHDRAGIELLSLNEFTPKANRVEGNVLDGNTVDLAYAPAGATTTLRNCFIDNAFTVSVPAQIEQVMPCPGRDLRISVPAGLGTVAPPGVDYRTIPAPARQPTMPASAKRRPAGSGRVPTVDLDAISVPR